MQTKLQPPKNQHALVLWTLMYARKEISVGYWMDRYKSSKFSSRFGELENDFNTTLAIREPKKFVNRFGHKSTYMTYKPILSRLQYIEFYNQINK